LRKFVYAGLWLAGLGFGFVFAPFDIILMAIVTVLTLLSVSFYLVEWVRHMNTFGGVIRGYRAVFGSCVNWW